MAFLGRCAFSNTFQLTLESTISFAQSQSGCPSVQIRRLGNNTSDYNGIELVGAGKRAELAAGRGKLIQGKTTPGSGRKAGDESRLDMTEKRLK